MSFIQKIKLIKYLFILRNLIYANILILFAIIFIIFIRSGYLNFLCFYNYIFILALSFSFILSLSLSILIKKFFYRFYFLNKENSFTLRLSNY